MEKRKIIFNYYDTAVHGWTLTGWTLSPAEQKTKYLEKPNGDGSWDLSTVLTDGVLRYKDRTLKVTLECSEGTRMEREKLIRDLINELDGVKATIHLPDDETHFLTGRLHIVREYNDLAHAKVSVTAVCEPWKYAVDATVVNLTATTTSQSITLINSGRRAVVPQISVMGGTVTLGYGTASKDVPGDGQTYQWPELLMTPGEHPVTYSGSGTIMFWYREAVLE